MDVINYYKKKKKQRQKRLDVPDNSNVQVVLVFYEIDSVENLMQ